MDKKLKRRLETFAQRYQEFENVFYNAASDYGKLTDNTRYGSELEIYDSGFSFSGYVPCGRGCCSDYGSINVPFEFIYDRESYIARYEEEKKARLAKEAEATALKAAEAKRKQEQAERVQLLKLQEKYKDANTQT